jgi:ActR/RegA family two-component response regulator
MNRPARTSNLATEARIGPCASAPTSPPAWERISAVPTMKQRFLSSIVKPTVVEPAMVRLAEQDHFSQRLRDVLQGLLTLCGESLELGIAESLSEFETQLVRLADKAPNEQQNGYFDSVHELKRGRADVVPRFLRSIENSLAHLGQDVAPASAALKQLPMKARLALTESTQLDESLVLSDIATKVELRIREPLYTLGNRFGVLAGTPRISAENMPLGPRSLVEALRYGTSGLDLVLEHRLILYRCFERVVLIGMAPFYNTLNNYLAEQGILREQPILPIRAAAPGAPSDIATAGWTGDTGKVEGRDSVTDSSQAMPSGLQQSQPNGSDLFATVRQLLGDCRRAEAYTANGEDLQGVLAALQARQAAVSIDDKPALCTGEQIKQEILAVLRELSADGRAPRIDEEDSDTIDLIAMVFEFLSRRARADGLTQWILVKLQMPILRVTFKDKTFFSNKQHPARQVLSNIIEFSQLWLDETQAQNDPALVSKLQFVTQRIASEYKGDVAVFAQALQDLSEYSKAIAHNVDLAERRYVEAARGRENLERSRAQANAAISERIASNKPNEFLRMLLEQAWTDVLAVSLLRDGEDSGNYARRLEVVDRLLAAAASGEGKPDQSMSSDLSAEVAAGLIQVGLHADDVQAIMQKLFVTLPGDEQDDPISQTELAIKLRGKARLGVVRKGTSPDESIQAVGEQARRALTQAEQVALDRICALAPGTWFEFVINEQGDSVRRKLSWYSALTGQCLFINQRGTPAQEQTLEELAREMASERARVAGAEQEPLLDRAWSAIVDTLKYFSTHKLDNYFGIPTLANRALDIHRQRIAARETSPQQQETRTLLLVDDEENILRALKRVLRSDGYRVLTALNAHDGLEILRQNAVEVIICDQRMPGVCGTEFLSNVKKLYPDTVRIMLSGYSDAVTVTDAINRGTIYKFLTKPWNDEDIRQQVRSAFGAVEGARILSN